MRASNDEPITATGAGGDDAPTSVTRVAGPRIASDERPTRVARPPLPRRAGTRELLHDEEAARMRAFAGVGLMLALAGLFYHPVVAGFSPFENVFLGAVTVLAAVFAWVFWRLRDPQRYTTAMFRAVGVTCVLAAVIIVLYAGVFSPAIVVLTLGIVFLGSSDDRAWAIGISSAGIVAHTGLTLLVIGGVIPDQGLFAFGDQPWRVLVFSSVMTPSALAILLWQARLSRRATRRAVDDLQEALRVARQREAEIEEAYGKLEAARKANQGRLGRFTGRHAGRYELAEVIGHGAMGEVYAAFHRESGESAAVKVLLDLDDADRLCRFEREGRITAQLRSPHVVRVHEVGSFDDATPYLTMELLHGTDLSTMLQKRRRLDDDDLLTLVSQVAEGLEAAHRAGVVHRDIKPHNLFLCAEHGRPLWKILDFGVSRFGDSSGTLTEGAVIGTPGYMSPEQARGSEPDHRADVFALGAVAYRCLTGQQAFRGPNLPECLYDIVYNQPPHPGELSPGLPRDVDRVLALALAKEPEDRFDGALELAAALRAAHAGTLSSALRARADAVLAVWPWRSATFSPT